MKYCELKAAALPELAAIALGAAEVYNRVSAFEVIMARAAEAADSWCGYTDSERVGLRAAFALDADAMAESGFSHGRTAAIALAEAEAAMYKGDSETERAATIRYLAARGRL